MSEDLRSLNAYPAFYNFTAAVTVTEILLPSACTRVSFGAVGKEIYVCNNGATDGGAVPTGKATVPSNNYLEIKLGRGINRPPSVFVAAKTGTAEISIILEEI
tara:strand:+ start:278 stop:586 length:309 start_codon:yes stop_codon:yes gene_type:complete